METAAASYDIDTIVVDGFVELSDHGPDLDRRLYHALGGAFEVVGVAKNPFASNPGIAAYRGGSTRPVWVTSTGDVDLAAANLRSMAGDYRIPNPLAWVDRLTRGTR